MSDFGVENDQEKDRLCYLVCQAPALKSQCVPLNPPPFQLKLFDLKINKKGYGGCGGGGGGI